MWTAAILAGGQGRRLGGVEKGALAVGGRSIIDRQLTVLRSLTPHMLIIGRGGIPDHVPGVGAIGGLFTALVESPTDHVLVLACDMPFVTAPFLECLVEVAMKSGAEATVPRDGAGRHPLCAVYRRHVAPRIKTRIDAGELRVLEALNDLCVIELGPDELLPFDPDGRLLTNVNTPEDYARAQAR